MADSASLTATGTSDWVHAKMQCRHRLDVDVDAGVATITYTIETTHNSSTGIAKTLVKPNDVDADWSFDDSTAIYVEGNGYYRLNISALTGAGTVTIEVREVEAP